MSWYVSYGTGRMLRATGAANIGSGWTMQPCDTEQKAVDFAIARAAEGMVIQAVGEMDSESPPTYRNAEILALMKAANPG